MVPEVVPFSLFSDKLTSDDKARLASRLLTHKSNILQSYKLEKPKFLSVAENTELVDLVNPHSFKFFSILGLGSSWLEMNPDNWEEEEEYMKAREFVRTVKVTNEVAERGVKLASGFATMLTTMLLQGVERSSNL